MRISTRTSTYRTSEPGSNSSHGFTLIEVMAALAILAITVVPVLVIRGNSVQRVQQSINDRTVSMLAHLKLNEILADMEKAELGDFSEYDRSDMEWQVTKKLIDIPSEDPDREEPIATLTELKLTISYNFHNQSKTFEIVTYKAGESSTEETGVPTG